MAQMTLDTSFGPVFVMAAIPAVYFVIIIYKVLVRIRKIQRRTHLWPKQRVWHRLGPLCPPCRISHRRQAIYTRNIN
jgi:hypothetical protein